MFRNSLKRRIIQVIKFILSKIIVKSFGIQTHTLVEELGSHGDRIAPSEAHLKRTNSADRQNFYTVGEAQYK